MRNSLLLACLLLGGYLFDNQSAAAQALEDQVAVKSCDCLQRSKDHSETAVKQCIGAALTQVVAADSTRRYVRELTTVEAIQGLVGKVRTRLATQCGPPGSRRQD